MSNNVIALICCRGGSKGIPGKNIKNFSGKPLLGWTLEHAKESNIFNDIILSTDSKEIASVGLDFGATIPSLRPDHLATDQSDVFDTHKYIFNELKIEDNTHVVCILTNNPFIDSSIIKKGYDIANSKEFSVIALDTVEVGGDSLYFRQLYEKKGLLHFHFPDEMKKSGINRQSNSPVFTTINNMRWGKPSVLSNYETYKNEIVNNGILPIPLSKSRNFDLDDMEDWKIGEAIFEKLLR